MPQGQGHIANTTFAPKGAWQSDVSASEKCLGYDAFGSLLPGRNYNSGSYRHLFQGQEHDDEINGGVGTSYAFEYRIHDPRIGRFLSIDPLAAKYPFWTPYAFSGNRVIDAYELEGLEPVVENVPGRPGAVTAAPVSDYSSPGQAEGDFGIIDGAQCNYHCGIVDSNGGVTGSGWYPSGDYMNFAFSQNSGPWQGGVDNAYQVNENTSPRELPFDPYSGIDPNSGRNNALFDDVLSQKTFFPGQPRGITPVFPEADLLMAGRFASGLLAKSATQTFESQLAKRGILGFTEHGAEQMASRRFTQEAVLKIIDKGAVREVVYKGQAQIHYVLGQYTIATPVTGRSAGKIISVMGDWTIMETNGVRGVFTGF
jgi:RHS repeat-associated protein